MSHVKRLSSPRTWPVPRKGTKYLTSPLPGKSKELSLPLTLVLREMLKIASTKKEVKSMIHAKEVLVNGKVSSDDKSSIGIFDIISLPKTNKNYKLIINEKRKLGLEEIKESETKTSARKVIGKTSLDGNKLQLNLFNGWNTVSDMKVKVNDSLILDLSKGKVLKHLPLKEGAKVQVVGGSHLGKKGSVDKITELQADVKIGGNIFQIKKENLYVVD